MTGKICIAPQAPRPRATKISDTVLSRKYKHHAFFSPKILFISFLISSFSRNPADGLAVTTQSPSGNLSLFNLKNSRITLLILFLILDFPTLALTVIPMWRISEGLHTTKKFLEDILFDDLYTALKSTLLRIRSVFKNLWHVIFNGYLPGPTDKRLRPFLLRADIILRPPLVDILFLNPWVRFL